MLVTVALCPSMCMSITSQCSVKTAKPGITQTVLHNSPGILFSDAKDLGRIPVGAPDRGRVG